MKNIGFIDLYLNEWHADNYPAWIREACRETGLAYQPAYAYASAEAPEELHRMSNAAWCEKHHMSLCRTAEEVCEKSDALLVLAPSNPETHLGFAETVLRYGKPTYIDKPFAPDAQTAERIFSLADRYGTPIFSTSALRYADELEGLSDKPEHIITWGGGSNLPEYLIHQAEMVVRLLKDDPVSFTAETQGQQSFMHANFARGGKATMIYAAPLPFAVCADTRGGQKYAPVASPYFKTLIRTILEFYESGKPPFDRSETLQVMRLCDGAKQALALR